MANVRVACSLDDWSRINIRKVADQMEVSQMWLLRKAVTTYLENTVGIKREYSSKGYHHNGKKMSDK